MEITGNVKNAIEEVIECLILENMRRPAFTFGRIERLKELWGGEQNPSSSDGSMGEGVAEQSGQQDDLTSGEALFIINNLPKMCNARTMYPVWSKTRDRIISKMQKIVDSD